MQWRLPCCLVGLLAAALAGAPPSAQAACVEADIQLSVVPILGPSHVIPVRWRVEAGCPVIESGLLLGRQPDALAPAGVPAHAPGPEFQQDLPVTESGPWWIAAYARDEHGDVVRSAPRPTVVLVPPVLPAAPPPSGTLRAAGRAMQASSADDGDFLEPAGDSHYASLRRVVQTSRRFVVRDPGQFSFYTEGFDNRRIASTHPDEVTAGQEPPLGVGGVPFPVSQRDVEAALAAADSVFADLGYPRPGLYDVHCTVYARFAPDVRVDGPACHAVTFSNEYFPGSPRWLTWSQTGGDLVGQSDRASLAYFIPRVPEGKQVQSARLRVLAFGIEALDPIRLSGKAPARLDAVTCTSFSCWAWATWDFTEEARALSTQGGGELTLTMDPVPTKTSGFNHGVATWSMLPRVNYPWRHGGEDGALTITFEDACPKELVLSVSPALVRPRVPAGQLRASTPNLPTEATVEVVVHVCGGATSVGPLDVELSIEPPSPGSSYRGGHLHTGIARPTGSLVDSREQAANGCRVDVLETGIGSCSVRYRAGVLSGAETIVARSDGFADAHVDIVLNITGLTPLAASEGNLARLTGQNPGRHVDNHYGTLNTNSSIMAVAIDYFEKYGATLGINDLSLPNGGLFDICGTWSPGDTCGNAPNGGHFSHRVGTSVDIDRTACVDPDLSGGCGRGTRTVSKDYIGERCELRGDGWLAKESSIHCEFPR